MKKTLKIIAIFLVCVQLFSCATIYGGYITDYQKTKPAPGEPPRKIRTGALIANVFLGIVGPMGIAIDFATGAIYKPAPDGFYPQLYLQDTLDSKTPQEYNYLLMSGRKNPKKRISIPQYNEIVVFKSNEEKIKGNFKIIDANTIAIGEELITLQDISSIIIHDKDNTFRTIGGVFSVAGGLGTAALGIFVTNYLLNYGGVLTPFITLTVPLAIGGIVATGMGVVLLSKLKNGITNKEWVYSVY